MDSAITTIHQCIQRGERPLSLVDLIEKDLLSLNQAAWLVSRIDEGSSWLVGALPGNAGKTTLMNALLVFIQAHEEATLAGVGAPWHSFGQNCCVAVEEISDHNPSRYLWDEDVRGLTAVPARGGRIASTIHATTLEQVREQIAHQCAAGENGVAAFGTFIPIEVTYAPDSLEHAPVPQEGRRRRTINTRTIEVIHHHDDGKWHTIDREFSLTREQESISGFLRSCLESGISSCESLRKAWLTAR